MTTKVTDANFIDVHVNKVTNINTAFDDDSIINDLSTLALRQASNEDKVKYNTNSMYVDVFQDSSGITGLTQTSRNAAEYISSITTSTTNSTVQFDSLSPTYSTFGNFTSGVPGGDPSTFIHDVLTDNVQNTGFGTASAATGGGFIMDMGAISTFNSGVIYIGNLRTNGDPSQWTVTTSTDGTNYSAWNLTGTSYTMHVVVGSASTLTSANSSGQLNFEGHDGNGDGSIALCFSVPTVVARYIKVTLTGATFHNAAAYVSQWDYGTVITPVSTDTVNATGSFESNAITSSTSISSMGAVITYQDQAGTNALNTDIVLKLSADGGSNYATATLTPLPDFSTGIKMAKVNNLTVTTGTSLKYKIEFANQAAGSKEA